MPKHSKKRCRRPGSAAGAAVTTDTTTTGSPAHLLASTHTSAAAVAAYKDKFLAGLPFPHLQIKHALPDPLIDAVGTALAAFEPAYVPKNNDLYQFRQSPDLRAIKSDVVDRLQGLIYAEPFRAWVTSVTGVEVDTTVDMSSALYGATDYLLCHDDDLSERRIAWIIYLVPKDWTSADGGALDLFDADEDGRPVKVTTSLVPEWNSLCMFAVSSLSHHQVAEVLSDMKGPRLTISGWFHGKPLERHPFPLVPPVTFRPIGSCLAGVAVDVGGLMQWVNPQFVMAAAGMQKHFASNHSLSLPNFLRADRYDEVLRCMGSQRWDHVGPPNVRHYKVASDVTYFNGIKPDVLRELRLFLMSDVFGSFLSGLASSVLPSGREFEEVAEDTRCFATGDYLMVCDPEYKGAQRSAKRQAVGGGVLDDDEETDAASLKKVKSKGRKKGKKMTTGAGAGAGDGAGAGAGAGTSLVDTPATSWVDVNLCVVDQDEWDTSHGGTIHYLTADEVLLDVPAARNTLSIVYRKDNSVMSFVKYVNHLSTENRFDVHLQFPVPK